MKKTITILALLVISVNASAGGLAASLAGKMDYLIARQNVVSGNIANATTPGFLAQDVHYKPAKAVARGSVRMHATNSKHLAPSTIQSKYKTTYSKKFIRNDGNSVRVDEEMLKMAKIQQEYTLATRLFTKHIGMQKLVVKSR